MSVIDACNNTDKRGFVRDMSAASGEIEAAAKPRRDMQSSTTRISPQTATDEAHAAVWTGIIGAARHIGNRAPLPLRQRPSVIQLRQGTAGMPVYFVGAGLYELHIAQLMPSEHSIYAVEIAWPAAWHDAAAKNDTEATPVLEDMVGPYVAALSAHVGSAPCVLVGYSFHGIMAFEIAHQLQAKGGKVEMVIMVDAPADYPAAHKIAWRNLREVWWPAPARSAAAATPPSLASRVSISLSIAGWAMLEGARFLKRRLVETAFRDPGKLTTKLDTLGRPMTWQLIERLYANSIRSYRRRRLGCRGAVFVADRAEDCPAHNPDPSLGWGDLFGKDIEIIQATGDHITLMRQHPHDINLAQQLSDLLDRTRATVAPSAARDAAVAATSEA
jgi:thioesterase domain-containing protein